MSHIYSFERLEVWQLARKFAKSIYRVTTDFPKEEKYGLVSQLRRAVISVNSNIAEGNSKSSFKERMRFTEIAFSSLMEVLNQLILSNDLGYMDESTSSGLREQVELLGNKINSLRNYQMRNIIK